MMSIIVKVNNNANNICNHNDMSDDNNYNNNNNDNNNNKNSFIKSVTINKYIYIIKKKVLKEWFLH